MPFRILPVRFILRNHLGVPRLRLRLREPAGQIEQRGQPFLTRGRVVLTLDDKLAERFKADGQKNTGFKLIDDRTLEAATPDALFEVATSQDEEYEVSMTFEDTAPRTGEAAEDVEPVTYFYEVVQEDADSGEVQGGITYDVRVPPPV